MPLDIPCVGTDFYLFNAIAPAVQFSELADVCHSAFQPILPEGALASQQNYESLWRHAVLIGSADPWEYAMAYLGRGTVCYMTSDPENRPLKPQEPNREIAAAHKLAKLNSWIHESRRENARSILDYLKAVESALRFAPDGSQNTEFVEALKDTQRHIYSLKDAYAFPDEPSPEDAPFRDRDILEEPWKDPQAYDRPLSLIHQHIQSSPTHARENP